MISILKLLTNLDFFTNKNFKYLFYKFNDYLLFSGQSTVPVRHSKIVENEVVMKYKIEIDNI